MNAAPPSSSPIQTVLSALESHQILPKKQARGLRTTYIHYRRSGIAPCPEDESIFLYIFIIQKNLHYVKVLARIRDIYSEIVTQIGRPVISTLNQNHQCELVVCSVAGASLAVLGLKGPLNDLLHPFISIVIFHGKIRGEIPLILDIARKTAKIKGKLSLIHLKRGEIDSFFCA